jgi:hypothetical protein
MQTEYRIEKTRVPVVLRTLAGERVEGDVFLQPYSQHRRGREEVVDLLNAGEPFFPVRCRDGAIRIIAKDRLVEVELLEPPSEDDARPLGAREAQVELTLADGRRYGACIFYEVPTARPRLLDYLNRLSQPFLLVHTDANCRLVNWRLLDCLRPLD